MQWPDKPVLLEGVPPADYHADAFGDVPTLSRSIAHTLTQYSPAHAYAAHPRLGGTAVPKRSKPLDLGKLVHAILLGEDNEIVVLPAEYKNFKKDAAIAIRDTAYREGRTPVLYEDYQNACGVAHKLGLELASVLGPWSGIQREVTCLWEEETDDAYRLACDFCSVVVSEPYAPGDQHPGCEGRFVQEGVVRCRARKDLWVPGRGIIADVKIATKGWADPHSFVRAMSRDDDSTAMQADWYMRGVEAVHPELAGRLDFLFLRCELESPNDVCVIEVTEGMRQLGRTRNERALRLWAECMASGEWPGRTGRRYPAMVEEYAMRREMERDLEGGRDAEA